jgi:glycosyltransferase involved in cell wall biosynthesis
VRFPSGDANALRERLATILALGPQDRDAIRAAARRAAVERWSWRSVAQRIAAAAG